MPKTIFIFNKHNYDIVTETQSKTGSYNRLRMIVVKNFFHSYNYKNITT